MTKPIVFSYKEYEELKDKYENLVLDYAHLKGELTNYEIRCRIAEADLKEAKANEESLESLKNVIDTQHETIETYHKIVAYQQMEIDKLKRKPKGYCKDCYMTTTTTYLENGMMVSKPWCTVVECEVEDDEYCSWYQPKPKGERKEE